MNTFHSNGSTMQELLALRDFYPEGCVFHWRGRGDLPGASVELFRLHESYADVCKGCREKDCPVRGADYEPK